MTSEGTIDERRDRRCRAVVLEHERLEHRGAVLSGDVLEVEGVPVDELAVPEGEHLHRGTVALDREPDHVRGADVAPVGRLPLGEAPDREQPVAVARGVLEALVGGCLAHAPVELAVDGARVTLEERDHPLDELPVVGRRDRPDARRRAPLDVEVEAGHARVASRARSFAGAELEHAVEHVQRLADALRVRVRPEVDGSAAMPLAGEHHPGELVGDGDRDVGERLVVAEPDVERRPVTLDEVLLEVQRLGLALGDHDLDAGDALDEPVDPGPLVAARVEVAANPRPERLRLAHVEDVVPCVAKQIDTRPRGKRVELLPERFVHRGYPNRRRIRLTE